MKVITATQGDESWRLARLGRPTGSNADRLITPTKRQLSEKRGAYLAELIAEWALGRELIVESGSGGFMGRGTTEEPEALAWLEFEQGVDIERVGFCTLDDGSFGWSLDGHIPSRNQNAETKVPGPTQHVQNLLDREAFIASHYGQVQSGMMGNGAEACWLVSYHSRLPKAVELVRRDETYIQQLMAALAVFCAELDTAKAKIRAMGFEPAPIDALALATSDAETF